jgi:hypothetical protein
LWLWLWLWLVQEYTPPPSPSRPAKCTHYKKGNAFLDYCTYTDVSPSAAAARVAALGGEGGEEEGGILMVLGPFLNLLAVVIG